MHFVFFARMLLKKIKPFAITASIFFASFFVAAHESDAHDSARDAATWIALGEGGLVQPGVTYRIAAAAIGPLARMNTNKSPVQRYEMVMASPADQLYTVSEKK